MTLEKFIKQFVVHNSLLRLWVKHNGGHKMIHLFEKEVCMEHEILNNKCFQSNYKNHKVIGVTDILCETYKEAINIVIED